MSAVAPSPAVSQRRASAAVLLGLPLVAALLGAVLGSAFGDAGPRRVQSVPRARPAVRVVAAGDLRFVLPNRWTAAAGGPSVPGFGGARPVFARSWNSRVAIALLPPTSPSLLPPALAAGR
ncbi:MAG: hypothetical protein ACXVFT_15575, partial [Solirubrobacteraceae bacterium]